MDFFLGLFQLVPHLYLYLYLYRVKRNFIFHYWILEGKEELEGRLHSTGQQEAQGRNHAHFQVAQLRNQKGGVRGSKAVKCCGVNKARRLQ